jgi:hypothetical protein
MDGASKVAGQPRVNGKGRLETSFAANQPNILGQTADPAVDWCVFVTGVT